MSAFVVAVLTFLCVLGAALLGLLSKTRFPLGPLRDDTSRSVRLVVNFFVVMTSLLVGLMMNSAKNTLETNNRNIRTLATDIILLDRGMRALGAETEGARRHLVEYIKAELNEWHGNPFENDPHHEVILDALGTSLRAIRVSDEQKATREYVRDLYRQVIRQRWVLVDASGGTIPAPLIVLLSLLVVFIFAGFGYVAPRNTIVTTSFFLAALLISAVFFLIVDMDTPSTGILEPIQVSNVPFQRALAELQR